MFVYGGQRSKEKPVNELWQYRFDTETWAQITISGLVPGCRTQHVSIANPFINIFQPEMKSKKVKQQQQLQQQKIHKKQQHSQDNQVLQACNNNFSPKLLLNSKPEMELFLEEDEIKVEEKENRIFHGPDIATSVVIVEQQNRISQPEVSNVEHSNNNGPVLKPEVGEKSEVKLRQRPVLQRQRPYSDVTTNTAIAEELFQAWRSNTLNHRSVEESMSYYSLCFPTPQKLASPPKVQIPEPSNPVPVPVSVPTPTIVPETVVKRRENTENIRSRIRRANLELKELNSALRGSNAPAGSSKHPASWHPQNSSNYYSLSLDISPDYEKELNFCGSEKSSSSNSLSSTRVTPQINKRERDLDLLEDYLEPEEMLEIVEDQSENYHVREKQMPNTPRIDKNRKQSVSHSSSGYQSLILTDSSDEATSGSPLSLTQDDNEILSNLKATLCKSIPSTSLPLPVRKILPVTMVQSNRISSIINNSSIATQTSALQSPESVRSAVFSSGRHSSWKRLSNWKPNIREVIKEVIVPQSPIPSRRSQSVDSQASNRSLSPSHHKKRQMFRRRRRKQKRIETGRNEKRSKRSKLSRILLPVSWRSKASSNDSWRLCMYVFGGRESNTNSTTLHRQPITIWKFYI